MGDEINGLQSFLNTYEAEILELKKRVETEVEEAVLDYVGEHSCLHLDLFREFKNALIDVYSDKYGIPRREQALEDLGSRISKYQKMLGSNLKTDIICSSLQ